jgi:hypothetical protein
MGAAGCFPGNNFSATSAPLRGNAFPAWRFCISKRFYPQMNAETRRWHSLISYLRLSAQICGYKAVEKEKTSFRRIVVRKDLGSNKQEQALSRFSGCLPLTSFVAVAVKNPSPESVAIDNFPKENNEPASGSTCWDFYREGLRKSGS